MIPHIRNLGYLTDCILRSYTGTVEQKNGYIVIRSPENPTFHWGNFLLFPEAPTSEDSENWIQLFEREIGKDIGHLTFGWDSDTEGDYKKFIALGFEVERDVCLTLEKLHSPPPCSLDYEIRRIESDAEWDELTESQVISSGKDSPNTAFRDFKIRQFADYRIAQELGYGDWWGAFHQGRLVADMGLYYDPSKTIARFQSVETHPEYRRRGLCSNLLHQLIVGAQNRYQIEQFVICTEADGDGQKVYERMGFKLHCKMNGISLPRNLSQAKE